MATPRAPFFYGATRLQSPSLAWDPQGQEFGWVHMFHQMEISKKRDIIIKHYKATTKKQVVYCESSVLRWLGHPCKEDKHFTSLNHHPPIPAKCILMGLWMIPQVTKSNVCLQRFIIAKTWPMFVGFRPNEMANFRYKAKKRC